jgi:hypothetical protein
MQFMAYFNRMVDLYNNRVPESEAILYLPVSAGYLFFYALQNLTIIGLFTALVISGMKKSRKTIALILAIPILSIASYYGCLIILGDLFKGF